MDENTMQPDRGGTAKIYTFSYSRAIACIAIVLLHTVFCAVSLFAEEASQMQTVLSRVVVNNLMWAVPCFLMVSGALLLNPQKQISIRKIFQKYISRMLIALLAFCMLFRILEIVVNQEAVSFSTVFSGLQEFFTGTSWSHLWYLYLMIGIYLLLPFYKKIAAHCSKTEIRYLLLVYVVFLSLLPALKIWNISVGFYICVSMIYPFYFFCGYALHNGIIKIGRGAGLLLFLIGTGAIIGFTLLKEIGGVDSVSVLYGYSSVFVILQSVGLFSMLNQERPRERLSAAKRLLLKLDACSFGIYLIHMIFVRGVLKHTGIHPYGTGSVFIFVGLVLGITLISYGITWLLKKIPGVRSIL